VRTLIRLAVLALAAFGAKTLYERLAPRKEELRRSGAQFFDRTTGAAREVGGKLSDATQSIVDTAQERAAEVKAKASEQARNVESAANDLKSTTKSVASDLTSPTEPVPDQLGTTPSENTPRP